MVGLVSVIVRKLDRQGRIVLPSEWRVGWGGEVVLVNLGDRIEVIPKKKPKLDKFFDIVEVDLEGEEDVRRKLLEDIIE